MKAFRLVLHLRVQHWLASRGLQSAVLTFVVVINLVYCEHSLKHKLQEDRLSASDSYVSIALRELSALPTAFWQMITIVFKNLGIICRAGKLKGIKDFEENVLNIKFLVKCKNSKFYYISVQITFTCHLNTA